MTEKILPISGIVGVIGELVEGQNPLAIFGSDKVFKSDACYCWKDGNALILSALGPLDTEPLRKIIHRAKWYGLRVVLPAPFQDEYDIALSEGYEFVVFEKFGEDEEEVEAMVWEPQSTSS